MKMFRDFLIGLVSLVLLIAGAAGIIYGMGELSIRYNLFGETAEFGTGIIGHVFYGGRLLLYSFLGAFGVLVLGGIAFMFLADFGEKVQKRVRNVVFTSKTPDKGDKRGAVTVAEENQ